MAALGAEAKYPNAINGQLFFKVPAGTAVPTGNYLCSATVQRPRIITTAGHCVSDGNGRFFKNWIFVPALRNGVGPFGTWKAAYVVVSNVWHLGGGGLPNAQDVASIELLDDAIGNRIADLTGYAGYRSQLCTGDSTSRRMGTRAISMAATRCTESMPKHGLGRTIPQSLAPTCAAGRAAAGG